MKPALRIALWAAVGATTVLLWNLAYIPHLTTLEVALAKISCPIIVVTRQHNISLFTGLVANTFTYALIGILVEAIRSAQSPRNDFK